MHGFDLISCYSNSSLDRVIVYLLGSMLVYRKLTFKRWKILDSNSKIKIMTKW